MTPLMVTDLATISKSWYREDVEGTITAIHARGVEMDVPSLPVTTKAHLHISEASEGHLENFNTLFTVGQILKVKIRLLRWDNTRWEVSLRAVLVEARWRNEFPGANKFPDLSKTVGYVERVDEFGAYVRLKDKFAGRVSAHYLNLIPYNQRLQAGASIAVHAGRWDFENNCPFLHPVITIEVTGVVEKVKVCNTIKQRKNKAYLEGKMSVILQVRTETHGIVSCNVSDLIKISERFWVGKQVSVSIQLELLAKGIRNAKIVLNESDKILYGKVPQIGTVVEALVKSVKAYGVFCALADNLVGLVRHNLVVHEKTTDLDRRIRPGDLIRVMVLPTSPERRGLNLDFVTMIAPHAPDEQEGHEIPSQEDSININTDS